MRTTLLALLAGVGVFSFGCMGCGSGSESTAGELARGLDPVAAPPTQEAAEAHSCEVVFSPSPEVADWALDAAEQWSEATGCDVHLGDGGIPIYLVDRIVSAQGEPQCGWTRRVRDDAGAILGVSDIQISSNLDDRCHLHARDVLHEMGHGLAPHRGHATEGLMAPRWNEVDYVDGVSAAFVLGELKP